MNISIAICKVEETVEPAKEINGGSIRPNKNNLYPFVLTCVTGKMPVRLRANKTLGTTYFYDQTVANRKVDSNGRQVVKAGGFYTVVFELSDQVFTYVNRAGESKTTRNWVVKDIVPCSPIDMMVAQEKMGQPQLFLGTSDETEDSTSSVKEHQPELKDEEAFA